MRPPWSFLFVRAGLGPLAAFAPRPHSFLHVDADGLSEELAHGAALLLQHLLHLLSHLRGGVEKVMAFRVVGILSFCLLTYDNVIPLS